MRLRDVPYDWKKRLWQTTDPLDWAVFADWLEDRGEELHKPLRWLLLAGRKPEQVGRGFHQGVGIVPVVASATFPGVEQCWRWYYTLYSNVATAVLPDPVYNLLPMINSTAWATQNLLFVRRVRFFKSTIGAYLGAATAALMFCRQQPHTRSSGAVPNWEYQLRKIMGKET